MTLPHPSLPVVIRPTAELSDTETQYSGDEQGTLGLPVLLCVYSSASTCRGEMRDPRVGMSQVPRD